jgi:hypothetical protein
MKGAEAHSHVQFDVRDLDESIERRKARFVEMRRLKRSA